MNTVALVVKLVAKPGAEETVAEFLKGALELANAEPGTPVWFALRTDSATFWILAGPIAAALMEHADALLAVPPEIMPADVLAEKVA